MKWWFQSCSPRTIKEHSQLLPTTSTHMWKFSGQMLQNSAQNRSENIYLISSFPFHSWGSNLKKLIPPTFPSGIRPLQLGRWMPAMTSMNGRSQNLQVCDLQVQLPSSSCTDTVNTLRANGVSGGNLVLQVGGSIAKGM